MNTLIAIFATIGIITAGFFLYGVAQGLAGKKPPTQPPSPQEESRGEG